MLVITFAESEGNRAAARHFDVDESNVRRWRRMKPTLERMRKTKRANRGKSAERPDLEKILVEWVKQRREKGLGVSRKDFMDEALKLCRDPTFKASDGWVTCFMNRNNLSRRRRTNIAQQLPAQCEEKLLSFQRYVISRRKERVYQFAHTGNADQTPLCFDIPYRYTVSEKGLKSVPVRTTGHDKARFTVMLGCTADGGKLPPFIVFKRKIMPKMKFPRGVHIRVHPKGWFDENCEGKYNSAVHIICKCLAERSMSDPKILKRGNPSRIEFSSEEKEKCLLCAKELADVGVFDEMIGITVIMKRKQKPIVENPNELTPRELRMILDQSSPLDAGLERFRTVIYKVYEFHDEQVSEDNFKFRNPKNGTDHCYLIDSQSNAGLFVWMGRESSINIRMECARRAEQYLRNEQYDFYMPITYVDTRKVPPEVYSVQGLINFHNPGD